MYSLHGSGQVLSKGGQVKYPRLATPLPTGHHTRKDTGTCASKSYVEPWYISHCIPHLTMKKEHTYLHLQKRSQPKHPNIVLNDE